MQLIGNQKFNLIIYKYFVGNALYAYVCHYLIIIMIAVLIIRPYGIGFVPALFIEVLLTNAIITFTYAIFLLSWECIFPPKDEVPEDKSAGEKPEDQKGLLENTKE
jgi:hypothetical protein